MTPERLTTRVEPLPLTMHPGPDDDWTHPVAREFASNPELYLAMRHELRERTAPPDEATANRIRTRFDELDARSESTRTRRAWLHWALLALAVLGVLTLLGPTAYRLYLLRDHLDDRDWMGIHGSVEPGITSFEKRQSYGLQPGISSAPNEQATTRRRRPPQRETARPTAAVGEPPLGISDREVTTSPTPAQSAATR